MPGTLTKDQRSTLEKITLKAREAAEVAARAALDNLAVHEERPRAHLGEDQRRLRNRLRARGRALGDRLDPGGTQAIDQLAEATAYVHWHRLLFTRFLAENHVLHTSAEHGNVPVTLEECDELAPELFPDGGARDGFDLACRFAAETLPGIFRLDDPVLDLRLAPNHEVQLRRLLDELPAEIFRTDDALGWTYQFWQAKRKEEVNKSGVKIGARELLPVTQLFTEDYMVDFLLDNTLGAWHAGKVLAANPTLAKTAKSEEELRQAVALPDCPWRYLRFIQGEDGNWAPAAGTFDGWPESASALKCLDPCMGSGHFVVAMFARLVALRLAEEDLDEAGAVAAVIRDNLFGLEIDPRCTQIGAFNLALAAWRRVGYCMLPPMNLACSGLAPNTREADWLAMAGDDEKLRNGMERLYRLFQQAAVLGSLINPRAGEGDLLEAGFHELQPLLEKALAQETNDDPAYEMAVTARGLAKAAEILAGHFTLTATNVPFLARGKQEATLCNFIEKKFAAGKAELSTAFVLRCLDFCAEGGTTTLVTPQNWLFLRSYQKLRVELIRNFKWDWVARLGPKAFQTPMWDFNISLFSLTREQPFLESAFAGIDVSDQSAPNEKCHFLRNRSFHISTQAYQLKNPDAAIILSDQKKCALLNEKSTPNKGLSTNDDSRFVRVFWETPIISNGWDFHQSAVKQASFYSGRSNIILFEDGHGSLRDLNASQDRDRKRDLQGANAWGRQGVAISLMSSLNPTLYTGERFDTNVAALIPISEDLIAPIWCYCASGDFAVDVRKINQKLSVADSTITKVPFDLAHWRKVATENYPHGLPKPFSSDPTQWLFNGHPKGSDAPLQVAVARLLGYRWPRQTGSEFPDCPALDPDDLESHADADSIVCLTAINRELPAAVRLRALLAAAFDADWTNGTERDLLAATGAKQTNLEDWLQDAFFEQHCKLFHNRPFIWHLWDGRKDGFHALVNYHRLDRANLEKLTYSYLGDWIRQQDADAKADKPGAAERLGAARELETELVAILEGEPPYDLFIRWKPLAEQPLGWQPDINDGVRLNIRPFMQARDLGKKGAGILRAKPNIKWDKDRGTEPHRDKSDYPWFWHLEEPPLACPGGPEFTGNRWNNVHLTLARKRVARQSLSTESVESIVDCALDDFASNQGTRT
ncbi:MAG: SAM-dependent DNA methyltransferase [Thiocapsa sp.]|uniref:Eco57I restriction-modification methylase domain-containing protein n=1 Tax=Thiocapsa sp. TaxID=2024551 RepID=UPI001BCFC9EE|nr:SAM-dependent DNA methyltransferase [Thiocapsa sp.]QVL48951.1 MAG: SAM-dependent DNA methyltransferase [Thiocapsa sp.]